MHRHVIVESYDVTQLIGATKTTPPSNIFPPKERYECNASTGYLSLPNEGGESLGMKPYLVLEEGLVFPFVD